jgi:hypothetical protein
MAAAAPSGDVITLQSLSIDPSTPVAIDAPLRLTFVFDAARELPDAFWEFKVSQPSEIAAVIGNLTQVFRAAPVVFAVWLLAEWETSPAAAAPARFTERCCS